MNKKLIVSICLVIMVLADMIPSSGDTDIEALILSGEKAYLSLCSERFKYDPNDTDFAKAKKRRSQIREDINKTLSSALEEARKSNSDISTAHALNDLAVLESGNYAKEHFDKIESLFQLALNTLDKSKIDRQPAVRTICRNLAALYHEKDYINYISTKMSQEEIIKQEKEMDKQAWPAVNTSLELQNIDLLWLRLNTFQINDPDKIICFEKFFENLRLAVKNDDKTAVSNLVQFPLEVANHRFYEKSFSVKNKNEFISKYDSIITQEVKEALSLTPPSAITWSAGLFHAVSQQLPRGMKANLYFSQSALSGKEYKLVYVNLELPADYDS